VSLEQSIDCPDCGTPIAIETRALMEGASFTCGNCGVEISMAGRAEESWRAAQAKFEALKAEMLNTGEGEA
jgi:transcription elongation factor Elf1